MKILRQNGEQALTLDDARAKLELAISRHVNAKAEADHARKAETQAINELNAAQRAFDAAVKDIKSSAPWGSDWHSESGRPVEVTP